MRSIRDWSKGLMVMLGLCVVMGALLTSGCGQGGGDGVAAAAGPPSNPNPTIDFSNLTQNWDKNLPSASRFNILATFNNEAVRDNNTGLVWEKSPSATPIGWVGPIGEPAGAPGHCLNLTVGGQRGWRLPSIAELASLSEPLVSPGPTLQPGHPFTTGATGVQSGDYWSASRVSNSVNVIWTVNFASGIITTDSFPSGSAFAWCVRGPMQESVY